ncbi:MAG: hypothetical protein AB2556_19645 [Candidatus Thiodiazotropha sp.]
MEAWRPGDLILTSRQKVHDRAQQLLFERHWKAFPQEPVPLLYCPKDTRRQTIMVTIPGPLLLDGRPDQQELVLNDVVEVSLQYPREVLDSKWGQDWALGYAMTIHASQGLTIHDPQKVWISDFLQWSNLAYLALSRVEFMHQLERVVCHPEEGSEGVTHILTMQQLRKAIAKKLVAYKRQDQAKGQHFNLRVNHVLELKEAKNDRCAAFDIELLWVYQPKDTQQLSVDQLDNSVGHDRRNIRLTCLECNQKRGAAALSG